jgi:hypothetical protein
MSAGVVRRPFGSITTRVLLILVALLLAVPASARAVDPEQTVGGVGSKWFSGDLLSQTGENCAVLGSPYTETMVSGVAEYGGLTDVPRVGQQYWTAFLVSIPGDPCGTGSSSVETDLVLPPNTSVDTSLPIRCFGQPSGASTFEELTNSTWSFMGQTGRYCPTQATPSAFHQGGLSFGFRPLATGQLFEIFVPVITSSTLVGAGHSPPDGFYWLTDATGVYANPGLSTVWANVFASGTGSAPFIYFARTPAAIPFWKADAPAGTQNRVEFFANLYTAGQAGTLCFQIIRISDSSVRADCHTSGVNFNGTISAGQPDLLQLTATGSAVGPNGGYAPVAFDPPTAGQPGTGEWDQDMKVVWTFTYSGGSVSGQAPFHTLAGPDTDGDGVPDASDACPTVKGTLPNGCQPPVQTDPDGDGVFGAADQCPTVNGQGSLNGCPPTPPHQDLPPTLTTSKSSITSSGGHLTVGSGLRVTCPAGGSACSISLTATASATKTKTVVVGTLKTSIPAGQTVVLTLRLNRKGVALLKKHHRLKLTLVGSAQTGSTGPSTALHRTLTITLPPHKKTKHH